MKHNKSGNKTKKQEIEIELQIKQTMLSMIIEYTF